MRGIFLLILFLSCMSSTYAQMILKLNPAELSLGRLEIEYEKTLSKSTSYSVKGIYYFSSIMHSAGEISPRGIEIGYRYYLTDKRAPNGFYVMPNTGILLDSDFTNISLSSDLGYQWIWQSKILVDLSIGLKYNNNDLADRAFFFRNGISPSFYLGVGYGF